MKTTTLHGIVLLLVICLLGFLSMGFQMVASRVLTPHFGSALPSWALLISTFLAAFSIGSMLGGWISRIAAPGHRLALRILAVTAAFGFAINAFGSKPLLDFLEDTLEDPNVCLAASCLCLFILPVTALSAYSPMAAERLAAAGLGPGVASGLVYGISTLGNIAGVLVTAFVLIPRFGISALLIGWLAVATVEVVLLYWLLRKPRVPGE